jgi:hypothetical protein
MDLLKVANDKSEDKPFLFKVGQLVRPLKKVIDDGQTKEYWIYGKSIIISRTRTMFSKRNYYRLEHPNGATDDFEEDELDYRFVRK